MFKNISIKLKKDEYEDVVNFFKVQKNKTQSIVFLIRKEIIKNGTKDVLKLDTNKQMEAD